MAKKMKRSLFQQRKASRSPVSQKRTFEKIGYEVNSFINKAQAGKIEGIKSQEDIEKGIFRIYEKNMAKSNSELSRSYFKR